MLCESILFQDARRYKIIPQDIDIKYYKLQTAINTKLLQRHFQYSKNRYSDNYSNN